MRVTRLKIKNFRGWKELDLTVDGHVLLVGQPGSGRTDLIAALGRVLDPRSTRVAPTLTDLHQSLPRATVNRSDDDLHEFASGTNGASPTTPDVGSEGVVRELFAEVEVTLVDLPLDVEQGAPPGALEPLNDEHQVNDDAISDPDCELGLRLAYRLTLDPATEALEHFVHFPALSTPASTQYSKAPLEFRRTLPFVALDTSRPLQLRADGAFRRILQARDPDALTESLRVLEARLREASVGLSRTPLISEILNVVLNPSGPARRTGDRPLDASSIQFLPEDGTLAGILRSLQPVLALDDAGPLPLSSHGSTGTAVLAVAEAMLVAGTSHEAIILADDFGEGLDVSSSEHLSASIRASAAQAWVSTRRVEAARAFSPTEIIRLGRHEGRRNFYLIPRHATKRDTQLHRHLQSQLLPALTATTVVIVEGPHDLATLSAADRMRSPQAMPLAAFGIRVIAADSGQGGGITKIPALAQFANSLGFRVVALIDHDRAAQYETNVAKVLESCDVVVQLPEYLAMEGVLTFGVGEDHIREGFRVVATVGRDDGAVEGDYPLLAKDIARSLHKSGMHELFLDAVVDARGSLPPLLEKVLHTLGRVGSPDYEGPNLITVERPHADTDR